jgi:uncharacterized protein (TIGR00725 family)
MGSGEGASEKDIAFARALGRGIAEQGWILLTGGRNAGVMLAASQAAFDAGGTTLGLLPGSQSEDANPYLTICLPTGLGSGRNQLNVLAADALVICADRVGAGTLSELALGLKAAKPVFVLGANKAWQGALSQLTPCPIFFESANHCLEALQFQLKVS